MTAPANTTHFPGLGMMPEDKGGEGLAKMTAKINLSKL
jgi:hypothetical protein